VEATGLSMTQFYISITGFRPVSRALPRFWWHTMRSLWQARRSPGNLGVKLTLLDGCYHTLSVWLDEASMRAYVRTGAHRRAMVKVRSMGTGKTYGYAADVIPDWDMAHDLWTRHARDV